ncbi:hypothetical protein DUZ99_17520 [Xylanibacillus composti]|uniref:Family 10 glycosylhydrolase n=1 Tax=Xylanibacillus composti TaxID=1572762 RepID=A0A8J4H1X8_9BACL|nr:alpha-amylase family protein [Xylanibacillus composti]MDT9726780.1 hypothetical protein [Xylanibacillus composti]GIQ67238.1 family 10 glycosylhydrolase [Xylanibacillus composti]
MTWWKRNNLRMIQNNLRESDANLDVDALIRQLKAMSVNVLMMNAGGIVAFYPTELEYTYRAAGQQKDLLGEAIEKAHANGMKFIARFDFSKAHESVFAKRPEWFYRTRAGEAVNYHGIVHTCVNSEYQREYSLKMIDEVISRYDVDGIFFNMFGYQTRDYSGKEYGICCCDNCKSRFMDMYGLDLPETASLEDPVYRKYKEFQQVTTRMMLDSIHDFVKSKRPDIAISTYNEHKVDIVRKESNTEITRPHPVWLYSSSENVKSLEDSWEDKLVSNCSINAIGLVHRFTGVSKHEVNIRLKESLASGSGLDFCIIGVFEDYPDRENLQTVADIFRYHQENEEYYGRFLSMADVALVKPGMPSQKDTKEYLGLFKMLKENHIQFDVIHQHTLVHHQEKLARFKAVIIPDIAQFTDEELVMLEEAAKQGVSLLSTGLSFTFNEANRSFVERVFGGKLESLHDVKQEASYFYTSDKTVFRHFPERDWVIIDGPFYHVRFDDQTAGLLPWVEPSTFGPPERAFGHRVSQEWFGAGMRKQGAMQTVYMPWKPASLYYQHGYSDHKFAVLDLLYHLVGDAWTLTTNAPQQVEVFFNKLDDCTYMLHLLNLSGFNGVSYSEPLPIHDLTVTLPGIGPISQARNLVDSQQAPSSVSITGNATVKVSVLEDFAAIVLRV